jgi:putative iron-dependent peroxidase
VGQPQAGIFSESSGAFYYLEYRVSGGDVAALRHGLQQVMLEHPEVETVLAFGPECLSNLAPKLCPGGFVALQPIDGARAMPATQRDIFLWCKGSAHDQVFDRILEVQRIMAPLAELLLDLRGFQYLDSRDLIGFIDGSANPVADARQLAACIPDGETAAGGSYVLSQQWVHKLGEFNALPVSEQEQVVGRTKADSIELEGEAMPPDSHVSRTDLKYRGVAQKIWRCSAPYGSASENGLYFLAFACEQQRFQLQLDSMYGVTGDGVHDRIVEFSDAVTGSYWLAPCQEDLDDLVGGASTGT